MIMVCKLRNVPTFKLSSLGFAFSTVCHFYLQKSVSQRTVSAANTPSSEVSFTTCLDSTVHFDPAILSTPQHIGPTSALIYLLLSHFFSMSTLQFTPFPLLYHPHRLLNNGLTLLYLLSTPSRTHPQPPNPQHPPPRQTHRQHIPIPRHPLRAHPSTMAAFRPPGSCTDTRRRRWRLHLRRYPLRFRLSTKARC